MFLPLTSTDQIISGLSYKAPDELRAFFPKAFDAVRGQILKLEIRQDYREPGKPYDEAIQQGDIRRALEYIPEIIESNRAGYDRLKAKCVEFVRCRPIKVPISDYTKWEVEVFRESSKHFEKIYWCNYASLDTVFDQYAHHDFMVFDSRMAIVQDYDAQGLLSGGWYIDELERIVSLITLFGFIKANCQALDLLHSAKLDVR